MSNKKEFYIRRKPSGFLGNAPIFWAKDGKVYTAYIQGAERFRESEAIMLVADNPEKWAAYNCAEVDKRLHLVFDNQDIDNLNTENPCGWSGGYAEYTPK